jgi:single-strand DNA-binding protein
MPSLNKVILIGNLSKDPEIRYTQAGDPIASFSMATTEKWTDKSGVKQERTEWHQVSVFGKAAQVAKDYLHKGSPVYVEGQVQTDEWEDKEGQKRRATKVRVAGPGSKLLLLGGRTRPEGSRSEDSGPGGSYPPSDDEVPF